MKLSLVLSDDQISTISKEFSLSKTTLVPGGGIAIEATSLAGDNARIEISTETALRLVSGLSTGIMLSDSGVFDERDLETAELLACGFRISPLSDNDDDDDILVSVDISAEKCLEFVVPKDELLRLSHALLMLTHRFVRYDS